MKKQLTLALAALTTVFVLPACTSVHEDATPRTRTATTTTSESVVRRPVTSSAVESTTIRSY